jgi:hypothetical protein
MGYCCVSASAFFTLCLKNPHGLSSQNFHFRAVSSLSPLPRLLTSTTTMSDHQAACHGKNSILRFSSEEGTLTTERSFAPELVQQESSPRRFGSARKMLSLKRSPSSSSSSSLFADVQFPEDLTRRVRPTIPRPLWYLAGRSVGRAVLKMASPNARTSTSGTTPSDEELLDL